MPQQLVDRRHDRIDTAQWIVKAEAILDGSHHRPGDDWLAVFAMRQSPGARTIGTEFGLWISLDGGGKWAQFKGGDFPSVAVREVQVQPRDNDLVIATHGRGIWIIDDLTPLRALTDDGVHWDAIEVRHFESGVGGESLPSASASRFHERAKSASSASSWPWART